MGRLLSLEVSPYKILIKKKKKPRPSTKIPAGQCHGHTHLPVQPPYRKWPLPSCRPSTRERAVPVGLRVSANAGLHSPKPAGSRKETVHTTVSCARTLGLQKLLLKAAIEPRGGRAPSHPCRLPHPCPEPQPAGPHSRCRHLPSTCASGLPPRSRFQSRRA